MVDRRGPTPLTLKGASGGRSYTARADHLDLDRTVPRQTGDTDGGAGVPPVLAEHVDEQLTGRVGDLRLLTELGRTGHEDQHLHDPDPVQAAHRIRGNSERVERGLTRQPAGGLEIDVPTQDALAQQLAVLVGQLTRHVDTGVNRPVVHDTSSSHRRRAGPDRGPGAARVAEPLWV